MSFDRGWTSTTRSAVGTGIEIQRILRSAKRKEKSAIERKRERGGGVESERGCGGVKAEKKEDGKVGGSMVRKRWTAKMEGDQRERPCLHLVVCMRNTYALPRVEEIYDARGPPAVYVLCRPLPPERFPLALSRPRFLSLSHDL